MLRKDERPRERLFEMGPENLTDTELLAIVIGSGGKNTSAIDLSREVLNGIGGLKGILGSSAKEMTNYRYIGKAKAACIKALGEIAIRIYSPSKENTIKIGKPKDAFEQLQKSLFGKNKEYLFLLSLNTKNTLISKDLISIGSVNEAFIHPRDIFQRAIKNNAVSIVLAHNHPSMDLTPNQEDLDVTKRILSAGKIIGITLLDHLIIHNDKYLSMKQSNLLV